jgi:osmoprotectant transport system substrate-binding protein
MSICALSRFSRVTAAGAMLAVGAACAPTSSPAPAAAPTTPPAAAAVKPVSLSGASFTVGSKDFSEQLILAQITEQVLQNAGATVNDKSNIKGSVNTRTALTSGAIDMYWEYTGTGWITYLKETKPLPDPKAQYDAVATRDLSENKIKWLDPAPLNNTYAFAVRNSALSELGGPKNLSDLAKLATTTPDKATFCVESEFSTRDDGLPGMLKAYGITAVPDNVKMLDTGVIYTETAKGATCNFGEVFATDGRIAGLKLTALEDDKHFFPNYNPSLTVRSEVFDKYPQLAEVFNPIARVLDTQTMQTLNSQVDVDGKEPKDVAAEWLKSKGFIK